MMHYVNTIWIHDQINEQPNTDLKIEKKKKKVFIDKSRA